MDIPGFQVEEEIGRGAYSVVYRATRGQRSFAVKIQRQEAADPDGRAAQRFQREAAVLACLRDPGLPAILELGQVNGRPYIVQEFVHGRTLSELIADGPLPEATIIAVGRSIALALGEVHRRGMVHRDVKPDNILIDDDNRAKLIDFGFAARASTDKVRREVAGTLLYSAPEQTGMLKRPLDGRTDLYALGGVLYECAAGAPPFEHQDSGELVRMHAVARPPDLHARNPAISRALVAVIDKLLAKDPDDRYQCVVGLVADLQRLDELNADMKGGGRSPLGRHDLQVHSQVDGPLQGRDHELDQLLSKYAQLARGAGSAVLIEGEIGMGKTRLTRELLHRIQEGTWGQVMVGHCTSGSPVPFAPLREALEDLLRRVSRLPEEERVTAEQYIRDAAGEAAPLLTRFSPLLTEVLGATRELPGIEDVRDQFYDAMALLLLRFAQQAGRALLVLEDVERIDDATRQVLARLAPRLEEGPLLIVATASGQEEATEARERFVADMGSALALRMPLRPLDDEAIGRIVAAQLGKSGDEIGVARRITALSNGSPFAATEYVRSMLDAGLLTPSWGKWVADEEGLDHLDLPDDVIKLVVRRSSQLGEEGRQILRVAALLGVRFALEHLAEICGVDQETLHFSIADGVRARVVEPVDGGAYAFVHTEVRDTLAAEMGPAEVRALHQRIAEVLDRRADHTSGDIYTVARHYALGEVDRDPRRLFETNEAAGRRALDEYAHEESYAFLTEAMRCAEAHDLELSVEIEEALGEVCSRTGRLAEAIQRFHQALEGTTDRLQRARLRAKLSLAHITNFHNVPAWEETQHGLRELGRPFRGWIVLQILVALLAWLAGWLCDRTGLGFGGARGLARERNEIFVKLCESAALTGYFNSKPLRLFVLVMRPYLAAARLGRSPGLVMSYSQQAVAFAMGGLWRHARRTSDKGIRLATELGDRLTLARCHLYHGFVIHLCGGSMEAETAARGALNKHGAWLDSMHYVDASGDLVFNLLLRGYFREAWLWIERMLPRLWFTIEGVRAIQLNPWAGPILAALGRTTDGLRFQEHMRDFCERAPRTERYMWGEMVSHQVLFAVEQGELGEELDVLIERHHSLGLTPWTTSFHMRGFYVYQVYARLEQAMRDGPVQGRLDQLARAVTELKRATLIPSMRAHALVAAGALERLRGAAGRAQALLDRADNLAREIDSPWVRFEVARQRAHLLQGAGNRPSAMREAKSALGLSIEQGWPSRARRIRAEFDVGETSTRTIEVAPIRSSRPTSSTASLRLRRQLDALLQVSLASSQVLDPAQQARSALDEVVRILGAERGFLFRLAQDSDELKFQAGRDADGEDLDRPTGFSTTVIETVRDRGEPLIVSGTEQGAVIGSESVVTHDLRSIVAAPLRLKDQVIGVLYLDNRLARGVFTEEDVEILQAIGSHIAIAQETRRAAQLEIRVEAEAQKRQLAESLRDMSHALSSSLNLPEVLARLLDGVTEVVRCDRASVFLVEEMDYELEVERTFGGMRKRAGLRLKRGERPLLDEVALQRAPVVVGDTRRDPRVGAVDPQAYLGSWIGVPLISQDRVAGVLTLESSETAYTANEAGIAFTFAGQAGIAIENARLFGEVQRMAITDGLTQTLNRRHFFALAEREVARVRRSGQPLCVILLDADHFKRINDTHGHLVGDQVLKELARRCQGGIRGEDLLGRFGGEEFVIMLPDTPFKIAADNVAERLRRAMAEAPVQTDRGPVPLTISLGVAAAEKGEALASLIERADTALYRAKQGGRDRVERTE